jgi:hypothetical protein
MELLPRALNIAARGQVTTTYILERCCALAIWGGLLLAAAATVMLFL